MGSIWIQLVWEKSSSFWYPILKTGKLHVDLVPDRFPLIIAAFLGFLHCHDWQPTFFADFRGFKRVRHPHFHLTRACLKERRRWSCGHHPQTAQGTVVENPMVFQRCLSGKIDDQWKIIMELWMFHCLVGLPKNLLVSLSDCISCQLALRENDPGSGDLVQIWLDKAPSF